MICHDCKIQCKKFGRDRKGYQRFRCRQCSKTFTEPHNGHFFGMYTPSEKAAFALQMLLEGMSVRSVERLTGIHRDTILRLLVRAGERCERVLEGRIRQITRPGCSMRRDLGIRGLQGKAKRGWRDGSRRRLLLCGSRT